MSELTPTTIKTDSYITDDELMAHIRDSADADDPVSRNTLAERLTQSGLSVVAQTNPVVLGESGELPVSRLVLLGFEPNETRPLSESVGVDGGFELVDEDFIETTGAAWVKAGEVYVVKGPKSGYAAGILAARGLATYGGRDVTPIIVCEGTVDGYTPMDTKKDRPAPHKRDSTLARNY